MAERSSTIHLRGLLAPVKVLIDEHGVSHLYAENEPDLFFAQGFNAARDRLFQLDWWRRRYTGRISEVLGERYVARDRAARLFLYRGDLEEDFAAYGAGAKERIGSFVAGINAYVDYLGEHPELVPFEFKLLNYAPGRFSEEDIVRVRANMSASNVDEEVTRARTFARFGPAVEDLRRVREPDRSLVVPDGLDPSTIPDSVLSVLDEARAPIDLMGSPPRSSAPLGLDASNNWAVSAEKSGTGRPVLANDPHRNLTLPSLRYLVHLSAPGIDVIGAGEPVLPGISIGHNGKVAFGFTVFTADQEDLYCYETDPLNPRRYRYLEGYEEMEVVRQAIAVRGGDPVEVELVFTRHGPVLYEDHERHLAFALRACWLGPGGAPYLASLNLLEASDAFSLSERLDAWVMPGENFVFADVDGNIGWRPAGRFPRRANWDGLFPVPGDGRYEWDGYMERDELPATMNPPEGYLVTANANELPPRYPSDRHLGYAWAAPFRRARIKEVLETGNSMSITDHVALQSDAMSIPARLVVSIARQLSSVESPARALCLSLVQNFDGELGDSPAACIYEVWYRNHLRVALLRRALHELVEPDEIEEALTAVNSGKGVAYGKTSVIDARLLEAAKDALELGDEELRQQIALSFDNAIDELCQLLGPDPNAWSWTSLHRVALSHPLSGMLEEKERERTDLPPLARRGDGDTPGCTTSGPDHLQFHGADFRIVIDVANFDGSVAMNSPGQSGDPKSEHYRDLAQLWASGGAFPLHYTKDAVERAARARIELLPG